MINKFQAPYRYSKDVVTNWNATPIGVYYCGTTNSLGTFITYYVGKATSSDGIRGRLLQHLSESKWYDVTHFGYKVCSSALEAEQHEAAEIQRLQPKYNVQKR